MLYLWAVGHLPLELASLLHMLLILAPEIEGKRASCSMAAMEVEFPQI
jgi:hypothetical protein